MPKHTDYGHMVVSDQVCFAMDGAHGAYLGQRIEKNQQRILVIKSDGEHPSIKATPFLLRSAIACCFAGMEKASPQSPQPSYYCGSMSICPAAGRSPGSCDYGVHSSEADGEQNLSSSSSGDEMCWLFISTTPRTSSNFATPHFTRSKVIMAAFMNGNDSSNQQDGPVASSGNCVVIVGAGFAGLTTAIECTRKGHSCIILDSVKEMKQLGDIISLGGNGGRIFRRWLDPICRHAPVIEFRTWLGEHIYTQEWESEEVFCKRFNGHRGEIH